MDAPDSNRPRAAWERYVETGSLDDISLRAHIHRAWSRCRDHQTNPRRFESRLLSPAEVGRLLEHERDLVTAARPYLRALSDATAGEPHAAMLSDARAIVLDVIGDAEHVRARGFPGPGSLLSEDIAGANGIGTCLAESGYVEIVGAEHFIEGFHRYTCQAVPLRGPDGEIIGALSTSVRRLDAAERVHEILLCAALGIEAELVSRRLDHVLLSVLGAGGAEGTRLEALRQDLVQLQASSRLGLERAARLAARDGREAAMEIARVAGDLAARFRKRSARWLEIASEELGAPAPCDVANRVRELSALLHTEAATRGVHVVIGDLGEMSVTVDSRELSRVVFRALLAALDRAPRDATLGVALRHSDALELVLTGVDGEQATVLAAARGSLEEEAEAPA